MVVIFVGVVTLIFSGLVALYTRKVAHYTKEVARCTEEYTTETRHLWEVTKKSFFVEAIADYLFGKYYDHIKEWPSVLGDWWWLKGGPSEEQKPRVFKGDCHRVILEEMFPDIRETEENAVQKLEKKGYKFS